MSTPARPSASARLAPDRALPTRPAETIATWLDQPPVDIVPPMEAILAEFAATDPSPRTSIDAAPASAILAVLTPLATSPVPAAGLVATNAVSNAGDTAMNAPAARTTYDVTGAGLKIGIISDSFATVSPSEAAAEEADGDLPSTVTVLNDYTGGTDEGRAMAELVHQVAPDAAIYFSTGYATEQTFANSILALAAAGCRVIVDDLSYFTEPFFQDGSVIERAIETVTAEGVSYFSAAGNEGFNYYQAAVFLASATVNNKAGTYEDFGSTAAAGSGSDYLQKITVSGNGSFDLDLQWSQPFLTDGAGTIIGTGDAYRLTFTLYDTAGNKITTATVSTGGADPYAILQFTNPNAASTDYDLAITLTKGTAAAANADNDTLKYVIFASGSATVTIDDSAASQGSGSIIGHQLIPDDITVAAAPASSPATPEYFTSTGPGTLDTYSTTSPYPIVTSTVESKPDFSAPDGITTSVTGFSSFYGTSAAAPNAAAVAILMLQANPNLTPAEITAAITATVSPMNSSPAREGAGFIDAEAAVADVAGDQWTQPAGGAYSTAANWSAGTPTAASFVTLSDDADALTASYMVTVDTPAAAASTLTVGNADTIAVGLLIPATETLTVAGGATIGRGGTVFVAATARLAVGGATLDIASGGTLTVAGTVTDAGGLAGAGALTVTAGGTLSVAGTLSGLSLTLAANSRLNLAASIATLDADVTYAISVPARTATIDLTAVPSSATLKSFSSGTLAIQSGATTLDLAFNPAQGLTIASFTTAADPAGKLLLSVACYVRGTRIATPSGETPIEHLRINDPVLTATGAVRPIRWIGRRRHAPDSTAAARHLRPIRIAAGALAPGLPRRDLLVSPEHALLLRDTPPGAPPLDLLVPASALLNGVSITRSPGGAEVEYFHIELKAHDAIRAEGQAAETFVDDASRAMFDNAAEFAALYPRATPVAAAFGAPAFCAPRIAAGPLAHPALARLRAAIDARAKIRPGALLGHLDVAEVSPEGGLLAGWALDDDLRAAPVLLELLVDGHVAQTALADRHRPDLEAFSGNGGECGFQFILPNTLAGCHILSVRRAADAAPLRGAPVLLDFQPPRPAETDQANPFARLSPAARLRILTAQLAALRDARRAQAASSSSA